MQVKTRQGVELLIQSENDALINDWYRSLQDVISTHVRTIRLLSVSATRMFVFLGCDRSKVEAFTTCRIIIPFQAWESDEAIEEDMPESPGREKHDKEKENKEPNDPKKRGLCLSYI